MPPGHRPARVLVRASLSMDTTAERTGSRRHDGRRDRKVRVGVEGVRAHPEVDSEGGGCVVQRRARLRDTDGRCAARATSARAPEGHRRLTSWQGRPLGAASALDKSYSPNVWEGYSLKFAGTAFSEVRPQKHLP